MGKLFHGANKASEQGAAMSLRMATLAILAVVIANGSHARDPTFRTAQNTESSDRVMDTDQLAERELKIGRFNLDKRNYTGAINRFKTVVTQYPMSAFAEEALARLAECHLAIGIDQEAQTTAAVLIRKFPDGQWSLEARNRLSSAGLEPAEDKRSWISRAYK